jgi:hypothetical protein
MRAKSAKSDGVAKNMNFLCDVDVISRLSCIFPLLECVRALIKIAQSLNIFVCDFADFMKVVQQEFYGSIVAHMLSLKTQHSMTLMPLKL